MSNNTISIDSQLTDLADAVNKIESGEFLIIAADETVLQQLPSGNWIGGSIPYFMSEQGGLCNKEQLFIQTINGVEGNAQPRITPYDAGSISRIAQDAPDNGFTVCILPAGSDVHTEYAQNAPGYDNMFFNPIVGWISGVDLAEVEEKSAKTVFGPGAMIMGDKAVAMHVSLPENQMANINIINLFEQGSGDKISFPQTASNVDTCLVNGTETSFSDYVAQNNIDTRLPLVADYNGINVNVSIQDVSKQQVALYAPVFEGVEYQFATPVADYVSAFDQAIKTMDTDKSAFSCNCILNYLYSELEGKKTANLTGPITFGEIAYQLLNQTLVYMTLESQ